jgi:nucleotide-binding universal stress UspA family protein
MECKVVAGHPFGEVLSTIEATGAELLVLGSHGLKSDDFRRIGMLARRCVRKVPADVLLVRERQHEPFRCVVACVDFSENSIRAAYRAVDIAIQENAALEILHIYCPPIYPATDAGVFGPVLPPIDTSEIVGTLRARLDRLATELSNYGDGYDVRARVEEHVGVSGGIVRRLGEIEADLVILGTRGRTGLKGLFIGTTAERLIHEAPCSAFTVKPEGFAYTAH